MATEAEARRRDPWAFVGRIICHVTEQCNLACRYCSAGAPRSSGNPALMSEATVRRAAELVFERTRRTQVSWIFFGGEPFLAPVGWFRRAMEVVRSAAERKGVGLTFGLQTNGVLIDEKVADFCAEVRLRPSVTLDGPPPLHDLLRQDGSRTLAGIRRLVDRGLRPTILTVIGPHNARRIDEVVDFLLAQGLWRCKFNLFHAAGRGGALGFPRPEDLSDARWRICARMLAGDALLDVNTARWMRLLTHPGRVRPDQGKACGAERCGAGICHVAVSPEGALFPCDRSLGVADWRLGSVDQVLTDEEHGRRVQFFHRSQPVGAGCARCPAARICYHCCTAYRATGRSAAMLCKAHRLLWLKVVAQRERIAEWVRRNGAGEEGCVGRVAANGRSERGPRVGDRP